MTSAAPRYLARLKARGAEKGLSSNPQNLQKPVSTAFEPFEGDLGGHFSRNSPAEPEPPPGFCNALKEPIAPMDNRPAASGGKANELIATAVDAPAPQHFLTPEKATETWEERAAHLEYDAGLPREWAEHLARLIVGEPPGDFSPIRWQAALDAALIFADRWAAEAHRLGWDVSEVFGLHPSAPAARVDCRGLAWLLGDGSQVVAMDRSGAHIRRPNGVPGRYYRLPHRFRG